MMTNKPNLKGQKERASEQCTQGASSCAQLPRKEELGNWAQAYDVETKLHAQEDMACSNVVVFSEDISTALPEVPGHYLVRGLHPVPRRDASGELQRDETGTVPLVPRIGGKPISETRFVDDAVDTLQDHFPAEHGRVLRALMRAVRPLRQSEVIPLARLAETTDEVIAEQEHGPLRPDQCWYRVPTSCTHIADLSWSKFEPTLNDRDADVLLDTMRERGKHLDTSFDDDRTYDYERLRGLVSDVMQINEHEFDQIIDDFAAARLLVVTETHGTRGALLNHLVMAQAYPSTKPALARAAPNGNARTETVTRDDVKATGERKPKTKKRDESKAAWRKLAGERGKQLARQSELFEVQEQIHADEMAKKEVQFEAMVSVIDKMQANVDRQQALLAEARHVLGRADINDAQKVDALGSVFDASADDPVHDAVKVGACR